MHGRKWNSHMTRSEQRRGLIFFLLCLLVFPPLSGWVQKTFWSGGEIPAAEANVVYYTILFLLSLLLFWRFLRQDFIELGDWLPENLFALLTGVAGGELLYLLVCHLPCPVPDPIPEMYAMEFSMSPVATAVLLLLLIPLVEEILYRGVIYGTLRRLMNIPLAFILAVVIYALACVWRFAMDSGNTQYLLLSIRYLPMSVSCTWCYERGGSVWSCVLLHAIANGLILLFNIM